MTTIRPLKHHPDCEWAMRHQNRWRPITTADALGMVSSMELAALAKQTPVIYQAPVSVFFHGYRAMAQAMLSVACTTERQARGVLRAANLI